MVCDQLSPGGVDSFRLIRFIRLFRTVEVIS